MAFGGGFCATNMQRGRRKRTPMLTVSVLRVLRDRLQRTGLTLDRSIRPQRTEASVTVPDLTSFLSQHGINYIRHDHPPVFTCEEELRHVPESGAARTKNLFMRDRRGRRHLLLVTVCSKNVSIADFAETSGADRLSFASPERLMKLLGVEPGSVTLLGLVNDAVHAVEVYIDQDVWAAPSIHAHPLRNDATLVLSHENVVRFMAATGHQPRIVTVRSRPS
jgi:Ala-tRNA(Pro) deacylase